MFASGAAGKDPRDPVYTLAGGGIQVTQVYLKVAQNSVIINEEFNICFSVVL